MLDLPGNLKVLVIGSGGREHAICWKLAQSPLVSRVFCAPGNGGTAMENKTANVDIGVLEFARLADFARHESVDLIVVGPDDPIAAGAVDYLQNAGLRVFGPTKSAARLESSKSFAKDFMVKNQLPTARYLVCDSLEQALDAVREHPWARVIKADGLALGKGVFVCDSQEDAVDALQAIFRERRFGEAGSRVVIEEKLAGQEVSLLLFCDGKKLLPMPASQDHKRRFDGDKGPNTGGMGCYSPVDIYRHAKTEIESQVLEPLRRALHSRALDYQGVLYVGLMIETRILDGGRRAYQPYVLEFNARFGDPETQTLLPLLTSDLLPVLWACTQGKLAQAEPEWAQQASCCVVAATEAYPESSSKGAPISLGKLPPDTYLFQAGTKLDGGKLLTNGGRVLAVVATGANLDAAASTAYAGLEHVSFPALAYRKDIARRSQAACLSP